LGERLKPYTLETPKPLISIHGRPFLWYLIERLKNFSVSEILLLTGYRAELFDTYKREYETASLKIKTIPTPVDFSTGRRFLSASESLENEFLVLYGDNYWPFELNKLYKNFVEHSKIGQIIGYLNNDNYSSSNLLIDKKGLVQLYDKTRRSKDVSHVDIGFGIYSKKVIDKVKFEINENFEYQVYPALIKDQQLSGISSSHRYYTLTSPIRLQKVSNVLNPRRKFIFMDRDGVVNIKPNKGDYVKSWSEWIWKPDAKEALKYLHEINVRVILITNQACIGRRIITQPDLDSIHTRMQQELDEINGNSIEAIYICPHHWEDECECRKPKTGLFYQAQKDFDIDLSKAHFIGDSETDRMAAFALEIQYWNVDENCNLLNIVKNLSLQSYELL
jgi:D-glycero-D-manno-heptose 1,7-bisphosphate phosphatase